MEGRANQRRRAASVDRTHASLSFSPAFLSYISFFHTHLSPALLNIYLPPAAVTMAALIHKQTLAHPFLLINLRCEDHTTIERRVHTYTVLSNTSGRLPLHTHTTLMASTLLGGLCARCRSVFIGIFDHSSRRAFARSGSDVEQKPPLQLCILSGLDNRKSQLADQKPQRGPSTEDLHQ